MKRNSNKKGFTIVELVIVIAVIAILAAVMIPTFGNVIEKANDSSRQQAAAAAYKEAYAVAMTNDGEINAEDDIVTTDSGFTFDFTTLTGDAPKITVTVDETKQPKFKGYTVSIDNGNVKVSPKTNTDSGTTTE